MELQELKNIWAEYDRKLDKTLQVNMQLLRQLKLDKVQGKANGLLTLKIFEIAMLLIMLGWLGDFMLKYYRQPQFMISAFVLLVFVALGIVSVIRQLSIITQLKLGYDDAIAPVQKNIQSLKAVIITTLKYALLLIPCYPFLLIIAGKMIFNVDFTEGTRRAYLLSNVVAAFIFLIPTIWIFIALSRENIKPWAKTLLFGSGWYQANAAADFLKEIEAFEKEA